MKYIYSALISLLLLGIMQQAQALVIIPNQITGSISVCEGDQVLYFAPDTAGSNFSWSVTGGAIMGINNADSVLVLWGSPGTGIISVIITHPNGPPDFLFLNVTIHPKPTPSITHPPYPTCPSVGHGSSPRTLLDGGSGSPGNGQGPACENVCKLSTITYSTPLNAGSTYSWNIIGALSYTGQNTNSVTVNWDTTGTGSLTVYETNQWGCIDSASLCIVKVDLPIAAFTNPLNVCKNSTVTFTNLSIGALTYQWYFGDGGSSTLASPTHAYANGGTYTITLIVYNKCYCSDTVQHTINIDSNPGPDITCPATVCANATGTYSTSVSGCTYSWFAQGGTIVGPSNQQSVTVAWGAGQLGKLGLIVGGCGSVCSDTTWIDIPIIPAVGVIAGPSRVCPGDCATYSLPKFSGAIYTWWLNSGSCGQITDTSCCGRVKICWSEYVGSCDDTLHVTFYDNFLQCGGSATLIIHVSPVLLIYGTTTACSQGTSSLSASYGINCNWTVSPPGAVIIPNPSSFVNIYWGGVAGTYTVTAKPVIANDACNDSATIVITVLGPPPAPVITGDTIVCPNSSVQYCTSTPGNIVWQVTGGTPTNGTGSCMSVSWGNTPPFIVQAYNYTNSSPSCYSDTTTQNITVILSIPTPSIIGNPVACANMTQSYSTNVVLPAGATYQWTIAPPSAGAITSGQGTSSIQIEWGNNAPQTVVISLTASVCGLMATGILNVTLTPNPVPTVAQTGNLCLGGSAQLNASGGAYIAYQWTGPGGFTSSLNPVTISLAGLYQVTVTNSNGCTAISQYTAQYVGSPTASISALDPTNYCTGASYTVNLCALGNPNYTYSWSNGPSTQCVSVNSTGSYLVTVTDATNGCMAVSNVIAIIEAPCNGSGGGGGGTPCVPNGSADFTFASCNPKVFTNASVNGISYYWDFGDGGNSTAPNPSHTYTQAGFFTVTLYTTVPDAAGTGTCVVSASKLIEIPLLAKFDVATACFGSPYCFTDKSVTTAGNSITTWSWDFGDANFSNLQSPCHTYAGPGTYTVILTISNPNCTTSVSVNVVVNPKPTAAFSFSNNACVNSAISFTDNSISNINYWKWSFGNAGTSLNQNPSQSYALSGNYTVKLVVHDMTGCYDSTTMSVTINNPTVSGNITAFPDTIVCAGTSVLLVAPPCPTCTYSWSNGSTNDSITVTSTGIYAVNITDANGCTYFTYIKITVLQKPQAIISGASNKICLGSYASLSVPYNANWNYFWISNDIPINGYTYSSAYTSPASPGTYNYKVIITDMTTGCTDTTLPFILRVDSSAVAASITALGPNTFCKGDSVQLVLSSPDPYFPFQWSTGEITDTITVKTSGCYGVVVTDTSGCTASDTYCVTVNPMPEVCSFWTGCLDTCAMYTMYGPPGAATYQWLFNGNPIPGANAPSYMTSISGDYSVIVTSIFGCIDTTGVLHLTIHFCPDTKCAELIMDSVLCGPVPGQFLLWYHVINNAQVPVGAVGLVLQPPFGGATYSPSYVPVIIPPNGGNSGPLSANIVNGTPGSTLCFLSRIFVIDSLGNEQAICKSDTACITLPTNCKPVTSCCYLNFVHDSIWCVFNETGSHSYHFNLELNGCGVLNIFTNNDGNLALANPYTLTGGLITISGVYTPNTDTVLCLTFIMGDIADICVDKTICLELPHCPPPSSPCDSLHAAFSLTANNLTGSFLDQSWAAGGMIVTGWSWNFGDPISGVNNTSNLQNPVHTCTAQGVYIVCLVITGTVPGTNIICYDTVCKDLTFFGHPTSPCDSLHAAFTFSNTGLTANFLDQSWATGGMIITSWAWNFGDPASGPNNTALGPNPSHTFSGSGTYTVCLVITGIIEGTNIICHDTICHTLTVGCEPVITNCPSNLTVFTGPGRTSCDQAATWEEPTLSDNCAGFTLSSNHQPGDIFPVGVSVVTYTLIDVLGNTSTCTLSITVIDNTPPVIACPNNLTVYATDGLCGAFVKCHSGPCFPPDGKEFSGVCLLHFGATTYLINPRFYNLSPCSTLPATVGESAVVSFTAMFTATLVLPTGNPVIIDAPAQITINVTKTGNSNGTDFFDTEMLQMNISGGNLPAGTMIRESPTLASTGKTTLKYAGGDWEIDSFFDVWMDLTTNNGQSWTPASAAAHIILKCPLIVSDNCPGPVTIVQTSGLPFGSLFPLGTTVNVYVATDAAGNTATCTFSVTIIDNTPPVITNCPSDQTVFTGPENTSCSQAATWVTPSAADNCSGVTLSANHHSGEMFPVGVTIVVYTAVDAQGNTVTCTFRISVVDNTPPVISGCPSNQTVYTGPGSTSCSHSASWETPSVSDNCNGFTLTSDHHSGDIFLAGVTIVHYSAVDANGNTVTCTFSVTMIDNTPPVIIGCPSNQTVSTGPENPSCDHVAIWNAPTASDNCDGVTLTSNHHSGDVFPVGSTIVTYAAIDAQGNTVTCTFKITVIDNTPPVITNCPSSLTVYTGTGSTSCSHSASWESPSVTDNCNGYTLSSDHQSGDIFQAGVTIVHYSAMDANGNTVTCTFSVTVIDNTPPVITNCPSNLTVYTGPDQTSCSQTATWNAPSASDNCGSTTITADHNSGSSFPVGVTIVKYTATDLNGNTVTCTFSVTVVDNTPPVVVNCPSNMTVYTGPGNTSCSQVATWEPPSGSDNCAEATWSSSHYPGDVFPVGLTEVHYSLTDVFGNITTCNFTVTVIDNTPPVIICPNSMTVNNDPGVCGAWVNCISAGNCLPPLEKQYAGQFQLSFGTQAMLSNPELYDFSACSPLPETTGSSSTINFTATMSLWLNLGGAAPMLYTAPAQVWVLVTNTGSTGGVETFDTEMLQLDLSGGDLPPGIRLRESPTKASLGQARLKPNSVMWDVSSFFDVWTELSTDNGQTWIPATTTGHIYLRCPVQVSDNCPGHLSVTQTTGLPLGSVFPAGVTTNTLVVTDAAGNTASCSFSITVIDNEPPTISCPGNITVFADPGICGAIVKCHTASRCIPPLDEEYNNPTYLQVFNNVANLGDVRLYDFNTCTPPPLTVGSSADISFSATLSAILTLPATGPLNVTAPAQLMVHITKTAQVADTEFFETEMLQMDISGGNLPSGMMIRESPTKASTGQTKIMDMGGDWQVESFFDIFTELSTDNGLSWSPSDVAGRTTLKCPLKVTDNCPNSLVITQTTGLPLGSQFPVGTTINTYVVMDASGNTASCTFSVTVIDNIAPVITNCPPSLTVYTGAGRTSCDQAASWSVPTASDNCSQTTLSADHHSGDLFPVGTTTVTITATDLQGNTGTCTFTVTVIDNTPPVISCPANTTINVDPGTCGAVYCYGQCAEAEDCFPPLDKQFAGSFTLNYGTGQTFSNPVLSGFSACSPPPSTIGNTSPLSCNAMITGSFMNANGSLLNISAPAVLNIQITKTGESGNMEYFDTEMLALNIEGGNLPSGIMLRESPTKQSLGKLTVTANPGGGFMISSFFDIWTELSVDGGQTWTPATQSGRIAMACPLLVTDNCDGVHTTFSSGLPPCSLFPVGTTVNTLVATDAAGNTASCTFSVTVVDNIPPVITCPDNITVSADQGVCSAVVCYGGCLEDVDCIPPQDKVYEGTFTLDYGSTGETLSNPVLSGFSACSPPPASVGSITTMTGNANLMAALMSATGAPMTINAPAFIDFTMKKTSQTGNTENFETEMLSMDLSGGNMPAGTMIRESPTKQSLGKLTVTGNPGGGFMISSFFDIWTELSVDGGQTWVPATQAGRIKMICPLTASDNCAGEVTITQTGGLAPCSSFPIGTTVNTFVATDAAGNSATCSFSITVTGNDSQTPVITGCPSDQTVYTGPGSSSCGQVATWVPPTASANCTTINPSADHDPGDLFPVGVTTVTYVATGLNGDQSTCIFNISVIDNTPPVLVCPGSRTVCTGDPKVEYALIDNLVPLSLSDNCPSGLELSYVLSGAGSGSGTGSVPSTVQFNVGVTTVTYTATDNAGNTISCSFTISVFQPSSTPTWTTTLPTVYLTSPPYTLTGGLPAGGTYSGPGITNSPTFDPAAAGIGSFTLTYTAPDAHGCISSSTNTILVSSIIHGTVTVGTGGDFWTVTGEHGLFQTLNATFMDGNVTARILNDIPEPGTYACNRWLSLYGSWSVTIVPNTASVKKLYPAAAAFYTLGLFRLNGTFKLNIDGRYNGAGAGQYLRFQNTSASYATFYFYNDAYQNSIMFSLLEGNVTSPTSAVLVLAGATSTTASAGNSNNSFTNNKFSNNLGSPANLIYSNGAVFAPNSSNNINNNEFANFTANGIYVTNTGNGGSWTIANSSFYNSIVSSTSQCAINFQAGTNSNTIGGNYIGGTSAFNGGGYWTNSGNNSLVNVTGISFKGGNNGQNDISSNYIRKIRMSATTYPGPNFYGIDVSGGNVRVGFNTIGHETSPNSILINHGGNFFGIRQLSTSSSCWIYNNTISHAWFTLGSGSPNIYGIYSVNGYVYDNKVFKIYGSSTAAGLTPSIRGISCYGIASGNMLVFNNMVSLSGAGINSPTIYGIYDYSNSTSTVQIYHNSVNVYGGTTSSNNHTFAFFRGQPDILSLKDNIFSNKRPPHGGYYDLSIYSSSNLSYTANYNDFFVSPFAGSTLGYWPAAFRTTLAAWKTGVTPQDVNSISTDPLFVTDTNLHLQATSPVINQGGSSILYSYDIDGDLRTAPVDIGADEYYAKLAQVTAEIPTNSDLAVYPNPFSQTTNLVCILSEESNVTLSIFNAMGQLINRDALNGISKVPAGKTTFEFSANDLKPGIYFCRMTVNNVHESRVIVKRMEIVR